MMEGTPVRIVVMKDKTCDCSFFTNSAKNIPVITPGNAQKEAIPTIISVPIIALAKPLGSPSTPTGAGKETKTALSKEPLAQDFNQDCQ